MGRSKRPNIQGRKKNRKTLWSVERVVCTDKTRRAGIVRADDTGENRSSEKPSAYRAMTMTMTMTMTHSEKSDIRQ